jgi:hypothetical protein
MGWPFRFSAWLAHAPTSGNGHRREGSLTLAVEPTAAASSSVAAGFRGPPEERRLGFFCPDTRDLPRAEKPCPETRPGSDSRFGHDAAFLVG